MIYIRLEGHSYKNHILDVLHLFYKDDEICFVEMGTMEKPLGETRVFLLSRVTEDEHSIFSEIEIHTEADHNIISETSTGAVGCNYSDNSAIPLKVEGHKTYDPNKALKLELKRQVYIALSSYLKIDQPWGILTGIRPTKIIHKLISEDASKEEIFKKFTHYYLVSKEKTKLAYEIAQTEKSFLDRSERNDISLYIGIPFCPTRCLYCSFTSNPISKYKHLTDKYIHALCSEISDTGEIVKNKGYRIRSIYIGGGTPTSISSTQLRGLLQFIEAEFDLSWLEEYTLEAGRPDSIDAEKLEVIKESRVDRISINPQSMNNETLRLIGREHTAEEVVNAFSLARSFGFNNINMDVIIGLPGENLKMFHNTLDEIRKLRPESLTVHTMAVKRSSKLNEDKEKFELISAVDAAFMVEAASAFAHEIGMHPYYLYRQKNVLGNLENVGYCKPGFESVYNIQIMEEKQTIIALGAGAVTKVVYQDENTIKRAFNVKNVEEYIMRVDEMVGRKRELLV